MSKELDTLFSSWTDNSEKLLQKLHEVKEREFYNFFGDININSFNWQKAKISEFESISIKGGKYIRKQDLDPYGEYPVYGGHGIIGTHSEFLFKDEIIIIGRVGTYAGNVTISRSKCWVSNNAYVINLNKDHFLPEFFAQMMTTLDLNRYASGSAQPHLSRSVIENLEIIMPPLDKQLEFAYQFNKINVLSDKVQKRHSIFEELISRIN